MTTKIGIHKNSTHSVGSQVFAGLGLVVILLLAAFLRFYQLGAVSIGNAYYAAAVKSMLTSWPNFFFVAFEPGGSISLDKPPLGFWLEAVSAFFLGLNGFALALPNALAGLLSVPILYSMVKNQFGQVPGLCAALVLAVMPAAISTERNNTIDGMLVFVLLLAAWAVWRAVEKGKLSLLLLGGLLVGLGFNIKMLQAYMILPGLFALYFFGARHTVWKRFLHLGLVSIVICCISLSWALIVDSVPADSRPYIGSSTDNSVMNLILGHNGIKRLAASQSTAVVSATGQVIPIGNPSEVGSAGILRLFTEPLAAQASWLLPLALLGIVLALLVLGRPYPLTRIHLALILWAGWLLPMMVYFSFTTGIWHTYYLIMFGPPVAALVGAAVWSLDQVFRRSPRLGWGLAAGLSAVSLGFQLFILSAYPEFFTMTAALMACAWLLGLAVLYWARRGPWAVGILLASLIIAPLLWSGLTTLNQNPDVDLPKAGPGLGQAGFTTSGSTLSATQQKVLDYLEANTLPKTYLAATLDSHGASAFILAAGRPFLTFGGYIGLDNAVSVSQLQQMVAAGRLRYILDNGNLAQKAEIHAWVTANCQVVQVPGVKTILNAGSAPGGPRNQQFSALYDCGS